MRFRAAIAGTCLAWVGCGGGGAGGSASAPTTLATPPPPALPAGTTLTFVSGLSDVPVGGATVSVGATGYTTNEAGQITLRESAVAGARVSVIAAGFFDRQALARSASETRFALWPRNASTGLDEPWTQELAYTWGAYCCPSTTTHLAQAPLIRIRSSTMLQLTIAPVLQRETVQRAAQAAADLVNVANEGRVVFQHVPAATTGPRVEIVVQPSVCGTGAIACMDVDVDRSGYVTGGRIVFPGEPTASDSYARYLTRSYSRGEVGYLSSIIAHELGHAIGLQHSLGPDRLGMMSVNESGAYHYSYYPTYNDFAPEEKRLLKLLYQRLPGNRFPDDETSVGATVAPESLVVCRLRAPLDAFP